MVGNFFNLYQTKQTIFIIVYESPRKELNTETRIYGGWEAIVTTEELEAGLAILARRTKNRFAKRKHDYLLKDIIFVDLPDETKLPKHTGSTSNPSRSGGGTPYYCVPSSNINIMCSIVDDQIPEILQFIQVHPDLLPSIRVEYESDVASQVQS